MLTPSTHPSGITMRTPFAIAALLFASSISAQTEPSVDLRQTLLAKKFRHCIDAHGPTQALPNADSLPSGTRLFLTTLYEPATATDAYGFALVVYADTAKTEAYIVQSGGLPGGQTVYGPLSPDHPCTAANKAAAR